MLSLFLSPLFAGRIETGVLSQYEFLDSNDDSIIDRLMLLPLKIKSPKYIDWIDEGGIVVKQKANIESTLNISPWIQSFTSSKTATFETWLRPNSNYKKKEGTVFSSMKENGELNFALVRKNEKYFWLVRTDSNTKKGKSVFCFEISSNNREDDHGRREDDERDEEDDKKDHIGLSTHLVLTIDSQKKINLYLNGALVSSVPLAVDFLSWDKSLQFQLAPYSYLQGEWSGEFYFLSIFSTALNPQEVKNNYLAGIKRNIIETPITSLVRHSPQINGRIEGSVQQALPETVTLNDGAEIEGDFLIPGSPKVILNGNPKFKGTIPGGGLASPNTHQFILNRCAELHYLFTRENAPKLPDIVRPPLSKGTRSVVINKKSDLIGDWKSLRDLTINYNVGEIKVPSGVYQNFAVNSNSVLVLGTAGAKSRSLYQFQNLSLNYSSSLKIIGPVEIQVQLCSAIQGTIGAKCNPEWLLFKSAGASWILNYRSTFYGRVEVPNGTLTINENALFVGTSAANQLTLNRCGTIRYANTDFISNLAPTGSILDVTVSQDASPTRIDLFALFQDDRDTDAQLKFEVLSNSNSLLLTPSILNGQLTLTYLQGRNGITDLTIRVTDTDGLYLDVPFKVTVIAKNNNPIVTVPDFTIIEDTPKNFTITATDPDGDLLTTTFTGVTKGTVTGTYPNYTFIPTANANGAATFTVNVDDGKGGKATAVKNFTITAVNDLPTVSATNLVVTEDNAANFTVTAADVDGDPLTTTFTGVTKGTITGTYPNYTFNPTANANGAAIFTVNVDDGKGGKATLVKNFTITAVNDLPVTSITAPLPNTTYTLPSTIPISATASDIEGPVAKVEFFTQKTGDLNLLKIGEKLLTPFSLDWVPTIPGNYSLTVIATDNEGAKTTSAPVLITINDQSWQKLTEAAGFLNTISIPFTVPQTPQVLKIQYRALSFDSSSKGQMNDALEFALLDATGKSVVTSTIRPNRDAIYNSSEGESTPQYISGIAAQTTTGVTTVFLKINALTAGTTVNLIGRLINNDGDTTGSVEILKTLAFDTLQNFPSVTPPIIDPEVAPSTVLDWTSLTDVSSLILSTYKITSFQEQGTKTFVELIPQNTGGKELRSELVAIVSAISDPTVTPLSSDGMTPDGKTYWSFKNALQSESLPPGEKAKFRTICFSNPQKKSFTYLIEFKGKENQNPKITSLPKTDLTLSQAWNYQIEATDPEGDSLSYSLFSGPSGLTVNSSTGLTAWTPTTEGTFPVTLKVLDSKGGKEEQTFSLIVSSKVPNRPPFFTSTPVTGGRILSPYSYQATASDPENDALTYTLEVGPLGMSVTPQGLVQWSPSASQVGTQTAKLKVADPSGASASQTFSILIQETFNNRAPQFTSTPVTKFSIGSEAPTSGIVTPNQIKLSLNPGVKTQRQVSLQISSLEQLDLTADVVILADISGSMRDNNQWIKTLIPSLDTSLKNKGLNNNRYAVIGFTDPGDLNGIINTDLNHFEYLFTPEGKDLNQFFRRVGAYGGNDLGESAAANGNTPASDGIYPLALKNFEGSTGSYRLLYDIEDPVPAPLEGFNSPFKILPGTSRSKYFTAPRGTLIYIDPWMFADTRLLTPSQAIMHDGVGQGTDYGPYILPESGKYTLEFKGTDMREGQIVELESGSTAIEINQTASGRFTSAYSNQFFKINLTKGQVMRFENLQSPVEGVVQDHVKVLTPSGSFLMNLFSWYSQNFIVPETGTYYLLLSVGENSQGAAFQFRITSNNKIVTPIALDQLISGSLANQGQILEYTFESTADKPFCFDGIFQAKNSNQYARLTDPLGREIFKNIPVQSNSGIYSLPMTGTYHLTIYGDPGSFQFKLLDISKVSSLPLGSLISTPLAPSEAKIWKVSLSQGQKLSFLKSTKSDSTVTYLFGSSIDPLMTGYSYNDFSYLASGTRTHYVMIESAISETHTVQVNRIDLTNTAPVGLNQDRAIAVNPNSIQSSTFSAKAGTHCFISAPQWSDENVRVSIYLPSGEYFTGFWLYQPLTIPFLLPESGQYRIDFDNRSSVINNIVYKVWDLDTLPLVQPGANLNGSYVSGKEPRVFRLNLNPLNRYSFPVIDTTHNVAESALYGPDLQLISRQEFFAPYPLTSRTSIAGDYFLIFFPGKGFTDTVQYKFRFSQNPVEIIPLNLSQSYNGVLDAADDLHLYSFSALAGQQLFLDGDDTVSRFSKLTLINPNGTILYEGSSSGEPNSIFTLPESGVYQLQVTPDQGPPLPFSYGFTLFDVQTAPIPSNNLLSGTLLKNNTFNLYRLPLKKGQRLIINNAFGLADTAANNIKNLALGSGVSEEGFNAMRIATKLSYRPQAARNMILLSDIWANDYTGPESTQEMISLLSSKKITFNAIVPAHIRTPSGARALAIDANNTGYVANGSGGYSSVANAYHDPSLPTPNNYEGWGPLVKDSYIDVATGTHGAGWDIATIGMGGSDLDSFTKAVVDIKTEEILSQLNVIDVVGSDPSVNLKNLSGTKVGGIAGQTALFNVEWTGNTTTRSFNILFTNPGNGRILGSIPVLMNNPYDYQTRAIDADGDPITFKLLDAPFGMTINATTGALTWTPTATGSFPVKIRVQDNRGGFTDQSFNVVISETNLNEKPGIYSSPSTITEAERPYGYKILAQDPNNNPLLYQLISGPIGMTINSSSGLLSWLPTIAQIGTHSVKVKVIDGLGGEAIQSYNLSVVSRRQNTVPQFSSDPVLNATVKTPYRSLLTGTDADHDSFTFSIAQGPQGLTLDSSTNLLTWDPLVSQSGTHDVILKIIDSYGDFTLQSFQITVAPSNQPPIFLSIPPTNAGVGLLYQYTCKALDPEQEDVSYELIQSPPGNITFEPTLGRLSFIPSMSHIGSYPITIRAKDAFGASTDQSYTLTISNNPANDLPTISSQPRLRIRLGDRWLYQIEAQDQNGDPLRYSLTQFPSGMTISPEGLLTWTPTPEQFGSNLVTLEVSDGRGTPLQQSFTLEVLSTADNLAPKFSSVAPLSAAVGKLYRYDLKATDADQDLLQYGIVQGIPGMTIDPRTGSILLVPNASQIGSHTVQVRVTDPFDASDTQTFTLFIRGTNLPPLFTSTPETSAGITAPYRYSLTATDPEGDSLTFKLLSSPSGMTLTGNLLSWTPTSAQLGTHTVELSVQDSFGGITSQTFQIVVGTKVPNKLPIFTSIPLPRVGTGSLYLYQAVATDADGETVTYSLTQNPAGMTINSTTGQITYNATLAGNYPITVRASDPKGGFGQQLYTLVVGTNQNPVFNSIPPTTALVGNPLAYQIKATDPEGELVAFSLLQGPAGATVDSTSTLKFTAGTIGQYPFKIQVRDTSGGVSTQSFSLTVEADHTAPTIQIVPSLSFLNPHEPITVQVNTSDAAPIKNLKLTIDGVAAGFDTLESSSEGRVLKASLTKTFATAGLKTYLATATDPSGNTQSASVEIRILAPGDLTAPYVELHLDNLNALKGVLHQPEPIIATIKDDNLASWKLEIAPLSLISIDNLAEVNPAYRTIFQGTGAITKSALGKLDPSLFANGSYFLRLTAFDVNGEGTIKGVNIDLDTQDYKPGRMTYSVPDLVIPLAGIPITVTRTYDSLESSRNTDFGYGWSLAVGNAKIEESIPINEAEKEGNGFFAGLPFKVGTRVTLTNPDGRRVGFTFQAVVADFQENGLLGVIYSPRFIPDPGVYDKLEVENVGLSIKGNGEVKIFFISFPYNPDTYKLTTRDGRVWNYQQSQGLLNVTDRNGNVLTYKEDGIYHSSGAKIQFIRDPLTKRITRIDYPVVGGTPGQIASIRYDYSPEGDLAKVTDASGRFTSFNYHPTPAVPPHFLKQVLDPSGNPVSTTNYDNVGRLSTVTDALGHITTILYDEANRRETRINPLGQSTITEYDERGNILKSTNEIGNISRTKYDANNNPIEITPPCGCTTKRTYDNNGNVLSIADPMNGTKSFSYDSFNNPTSQTDEKGHSTLFKYDANGQLTELTDPAGNVVSMTRDAYGRVSGLTDPKGRFTRFDYEETPTDPIRPEKPKKVTYVNGSFLSFTYNSYGAVTSAKDELGNTQTLTTDLSGLLTSRKDALNNETKYGYNDRGDLTQVTDPTGEITKFEVDLLGRRTKMTGPNNEVTKYDYDELGRLWKTTDPNNRVTERGYREDGVMNSVKQQDGTITRFEYDTNGRRTAVVDPMGNRTAFHYDGNGRVTSESNSILTRYYEYDLVGNLTGVSSPDEGYFRREFQYDSLNRLKSEYWKNNGVAYKTNSMKYDELGNLLTAQDEEGLHQFDYDNRNRTKKITTTYTGQQPFELNYTYDLSSRLESVTDGSGVKVKNGYNARSELTSLQWSGSTVPNSRVELTKNSLGDLTTVARYASLDLSALLGKSTYTLGRKKSDGGYSAIAYNVQGDRDYLKPYQQLAAMGPLQNSADLNEMVSGGNMPLQRTTGVGHTNATGATIFGNTYGYNTGGELTTESRSLFGDQFKIDYDNIGQVTGSTIQTTGTGFRATETFDFDDNGNRISDKNRTYTDIRNNRIYEDTLHTYGYDEGRHLMAVTEKATGEVTRYTFDLRKRLIQVYKNGNYTNYSYDLFDRRIKKDYFESNSLVGTMTYQYNGEMIWSQTDRTGVKTNFLTGDHIDQWLARSVHQPNSPSVGTSEWFLTDRMGTPQAIINNSGAILEKYDYGTFGDPLVGSGLSLPTIGFTGREFDSESGLMYYRARYYDPVMGRFLSEDPIGFKAGDTNLNRYVYNSPYRYLDPSGNDVVERQGLESSNKGVLIGIQGIAVSVIRKGLTDPFHRIPILIMTEVMKRTPIFDPVKGTWLFIRAGSAMNKSGEMVDGYFEVAVNVFGKIVHSFFRPI